MSAEENTAADVRPPPLTVLLAEDNDTAAAALSELIDAEPDLELVGRAADAVTAIEAAKRTLPDVAIVDVRMPGGGDAAAAGVTKVSPLTNVIAFSGEADPATVKRMSDSGASRFLVKGLPVADLLAAIREAGAR